MEWIKLYNKTNYDGNVLEQYRYDLSFSIFNDGGGIFDWML